MVITYRPVQTSDAENLLRWRNQEKVRDLFFNRDVINIEDHLSWLNSVESNPKKSIWIIENSKTEIGVVQLYDHDPIKETCWWSAYPVDTISLAGQSTIQVWLEIEKITQTIAKSELKCTLLYCESLKRNKFVVSMHKRFGFEEVSVETRDFKDRVEEVVIMQKSLDREKKMIILGSSNWGLAIDQLEKIWKEWIDNQLNITKIPYGQYRVLLQKKDSKLLVNHDIVLIAERIEDFLPRPFSFLTDKNRVVTEDRIVEWLSTIDLIRQQTEAVIYVLSFAPITSLPSTLSYEEYVDTQKWLERLNMYLAEKVEKLTNVQIIPLGRLVNTIGSNNSDPKKYHQLGRAPYSNQLIASIGTELVSRELSAQGRTSRVLVLDLDNTIWGGVIGEDGLEGIKLDNDYPGNVYIKIQEAIKALRDRGIVLAVCSKNDEKNALKVFHNHESMVLLENDIVAWRINWLTKVENIRSLSEELSLGLSSFAFLDDSPYERDAVSSELPDVNTITWPNDISELPNILLEHPMLQSAKATNSDKIRTKQYHARKKIKNLKESSDTHEQYLSELKMKVTLIDQSENPSERVLQLIEKTNQFNTTTRRHKKDDLLNMVSNGATIYSVSLEDKYSEKEAVGVLILVPKDNQIIIETFVLSCRVLGRDIENSIIGFCINILDMVEYSGLFGEFIPSGKNTVAQQSYLDMDFDEVKGGYLWRKDAKQVKLSPWIDIKEL